MHWWKASLLNCTERLMSHGETKSATPWSQPESSLRWPSSGEKSRRLCKGCLASLPLQLLCLLFLLLSASPAYAASCLLLVLSLFPPLVDLVPSLRRTQTLQTHKNPNRTGAPNMELFSLAPGINQRGGGAGGQERERERERGVNTGLWTVYFFASCNMLPSQGIT